MRGWRLKRHENVSEERGNGAYTRERRKLHKWQYLEECRRVLEERSAKTELPYLGGALK